MAVVARRVIAEPMRSASATWEVIVNLLTSEANNEARKELLAVGGIASSLVAAEAMKDAPIVAYGSGPRVRIYCLYGEDAIVGEAANESQLTASPVSNENWSVSLPCPEDDLEWVTSALKKRSARVTARDMKLPVDDDNKLNTGEKSARINVEAFLRS